MIDFRRLTHDDYEDILDISKNVWDGSDYLPEVFHQWVDDEGYLLGAVDMERNKVIGVAKFTILHDRSGWLEGLRVHKDYRGRKIARLISERMLALAKGYLEKGTIKRIAFSTHITNTESINLMKKLNFSMEAQFLIVSKPRGRMDKALRLDDFKLEEWDPSFEEFVNLSYFKRRNSILPLAFYFQEPSRELYEELKANGGLVSINGFKGIYKYKEGPNFACMDDTFETIETYMNYYILKFSSPQIPDPVTSLMPEDSELARHFREQGYDAWADWQPDYLYFVYKS
jgi:GNAT superfamily N-acetyltransferase